MEEIARHCHIRKYIIEARSISAGLYGFEDTLNLFSAKPSNKNKLKSALKRCSKEFAWGVLSCFMNFTIAKARHFHRLLLSRLPQQHPVQHEKHTIQIRGQEKCSGNSKNWHRSSLTLHSVSNGLPVTFKCVYL